MSNTFQLHLLVIMLDRKFNHLEMMYERYCALLPLTINEDGDCLQKREVFMLKDEVDRTRLDTTLLVSYSKGVRHYVLKLLLLILKTCV